MGMGFILLEGGAEFGGQMAEPDRQAITLAGGPNISINIIPAAAAPDNNYHQAGLNGVDWFRRLGAANVSALPLIDNASADDPDIVESLANSKLIFLLGGFPQYLAHVLNGSRSWQAILSAYASGAVIAGSSAGAMVLCEYYYDPVTSQVAKGLNLVKGTCILPHHNTFGKNWAAHLQKRLPNITLLGIEEETGVLNDASQNTWRVYGKGSITLYHNSRIDRIGKQQEFALKNTIG
jgi:cyanophycinase